MNEREEIRERFDDNLSRVRALVGLYSSIDPSQGQWPNLLRAAVVLLHASLEDLVRSLAEWKLPLAAPGSLDRIPLAGPSGSKEKSSLVDLADFRGRPVDEVISESVTEHLDRSSDNHPGDLKEILAKIEVDDPIEKPLRDALASLMIRRHAIAHRVDRDGARPGDGTRGRSLGGKPIEPEAVAKWIKAVEEFGEAILARI